jgi:uncharacterized membrane protein YedE/YeeE
MPSDAPVAVPTSKVWRLGEGLILVALTLIAAFAIAAATGARFGLLFLIGLGLGITLEALRFGFAGPWRAMIVNRDPTGLLAQLFAIGIVALVAIPLITANGAELIGAHAPVGFAMIGGAFVFGIAMQVVLGCGSGTLVNAGSGNPVGVVALPFFAIGSFAGAWHLDWWTGLGTLPIIVFDGLGGVATTWVGLAAVAAILLALAAPDRRRVPRRLWIAAGLVAALALANLVVSGQPWGVVYGLGLWAAKGAGALGIDLSVPCSGPRPPMRSVWARRF